MIQLAPIQVPSRSGCTAPQSPSLSFSTVLDVPRGPSHPEHGLMDVHARGSASEAASPSSKSDPVLPSGVACKPHASSPLEKGKADREPSEILPQTPSPALVCAAMPGVVGAQPRSASEGDQPQDFPGTNSEGVGLERAPGSVAATQAPNIAPPAAGDRATKSTEQDLSARDRIAKWQAHSPFLAFSPDAPPLSDEPDNNHDADTRTIQNSQPQNLSDEVSPRIEIVPQEMVTAAIPCADLPGPSLPDDRMAAEIKASVAKNLNNSLPNIKPNHTRRDAASASSNSSVVDGGLQASDTAITTKEAVVFSNADDGSSPRRESVDANPGGARNKRSASSAGERPAGATSPSKVSGMDSGVDKALPPFDTTQNAIRELAPGVRSTASESIPLRADRPNIVSPGPAEVAQSTGRDTAAGDNPVPTPLPTEGSSLQETNSPVNLAKLVHGLSQSEFRVAMHTSEFGAIDIRTSLARHQFTAEISVEHSDAAKTLSMGLPALYDKLADQQVSVANIVVRQQALATSSGLDHRGQQGEPAPRSTQPRFSENSHTFPVSVAPWEPSGGLDIHV